MKSPRIEVRSVYNKSIHFQK